jgi:non-ribosomal peptide synthetase component F
MTYHLKLFEADASPGELRAAELRFRQALEDALGSPELVLPVYAAYQRIVGSYGEQPDLDLLTDGERLVLENWHAAETAAVAAAFGPNRYMGDAMYEIKA